jgi:hypothetical protein
LAQLTSPGKRPAAARLWQELRGRRRTPYGSQ